MISSLLPLVILSPFFIFFILNLFPLPFTIYFFLIFSNFFFYFFLIFFIIFSSGSKVRQRLEVLTTIKRAKELGLVSQILSTKILNLQIEFKDRTKSFVNENCKRAPP